MIHSPADLLSRVRLSLQNAKDNGYPMDLLPVHEVAIDLATYDADMEGVPLPELEGAIHAVRAADGLKGDHDDEPSQS